MNRLKAIARALVAAIPLAVAACSDPVGPETASPAMKQAEPRMLLGLNPLQKKAVQWSGRHVNGTYSVSGTIGPRGGTLSIPQSDFTITFAAGAVSSPTPMTITALSGKYVAYDMQPHGIRFSAPVTVKQGLRNTAASSNLFIALSLVGAYVDNDVPPASDGSFLATELLSSVTSFVRGLLGLLIPDLQTWKLHHFSRYMLASG